MSLKLTKRDLEIFRTLVRVQLATTQSLQETFFPTLDRTRKRLGLLRDRGFVVTHAKGLPGLHKSSGSNYWRLTDAGLGVFSRRFPAERVPDNLVARTHRSSLRFFEHRNNMTNCYLELIRSPDRDIGEMHARANTVDWRGEFEVVLPYQSVVGARFIPKQIIPDATLTTSSSRYFLEIDQSTEASKRIRRVLSSYKSAFEQSDYHSLFPEPLPACVMYVTKSKARANNLRAIIASLELPFEALAFEMREATDYLNAVVSNAPVPTAGAPASNATARLLSSLYNASRAHVDECPQASKQGALLRQVYDHLLTLQETQ